MSSRNLILAVVLAVILLNLFATTVLAQDPSPYNPPIYRGGNGLGGELRYGWNRAVYDSNYIYSNVRRAGQQAGYLAGRAWDGARRYPYTW